MGLLEDAIASGDTATQARLSPLLASAQLNMATPPGAQFESDAPLGFTIADPGMRDRYANVQADSARAVAGSNYINDFERDRLKNTLAIMKASDHLDPDLQALVMQRLGISPPQNTTTPQGIKTPWGYYQGATTGPDGLPNPTFAQAGADSTGFLGSKLRQELIKLAYQHQLQAPERDATTQLRNMQAMATMQNADTNELYKREVINARNEAVKNQKYGMIANLNNALKKTEITPIDPPEVRQQKQVQAAVLNQMLQQVTGDLIQGDAGAAGGGAPGTEGGTAWWDRALPSTGGPAGIPQWNVSQPAGPAGGTGRGPTTLPPGVPAMAGGRTAAYQRTAGQGQVGGKRYNYTREK